MLAIAGMIARGDTKQLALVDQYYAATSALFAAMDKSRLQNRHPHPVHARNSGILDAWNNWPGGYARACEPLLEQRMKDPAYCFGENAYLFSKILALDPVLSRAEQCGMAETLQYATIMTAAAVMFWQRPHVLIEMTPALDQLLASSDISHDIPANLMRPPAPACYISFGSATQAAVAVPEADEYDGHRIVGAYVFESRYREGRVISICPVSELNSTPEWFVGQLDILIEDKSQSLIEIIQRTCAEVQLTPAFLRQQQAIAQLCTKIFLYWSTEHARRVEEVSYSKAMARLRALGPKKAARLGRQVADLYDRIVPGPVVLPVKLLGMRGDISPHWRRGHFRMQAYGPQAMLRKVIFIAPTLVRADRLVEDCSAVHQITSEPPALQQADFDPVGISC